MENYNEIGKQISYILNVDIFCKKRQMSIVDARSLYCYVLHKDLKVTLYGIKEIFKEAGMNFDHSSIFYNIKLFEEVRKRKPEMEMIRDEILKKQQTKYRVIKKIENILDDIKLKRIDMLIDKIISNEC